MIHVGDILRLNGAELEPVDVIVGGSPCQDLSVAGKRAGLKHSDKGDDETTRSGLFIEQIRIIKEMREHDRSIGRTGESVRPRYGIWENVPGALTSPGGNHKGEDFAVVLEEFIKVAEPEAPPLSVPPQGWPNAGYIYDELGGWSLAWRIHDAQFWGVPQRRRRISLVMDFGGASAGEILFERTSMSGNTDESGAPGGRRCRLHC